MTCHDRSVRCRPLWRALWIFSEAKAANLFIYYLFGWVHSVLVSNWTGIRVNLESEYRGKFCCVLLLLLSWGHKIRGLRRCVFISLAVSRTIIHAVKSLVVVLTWHFFGCLCLFSSVLFAEGGWMR